MEELIALREHLQKTVDFTAQELDEFTSYFEQAFIKKRQFIGQPKFTATHRNYVVRGAFRAYVICKDGHDHTIQFAIDDWWISDFNSYIFQEPAELFVVALEDSIILQISYEDEQKLKAANHKFETYFRRTAELATAAMQRRIISNLTQAAPKRYSSFIDKYPNIVQRVPQYALASFLGMTTEYLSKLRNDRVSRK